MHSITRGFVAKVVCLVPTKQTDTRLEFFLPTPTEETWQAPSPEFRNNVHHEAVGQFASGGCCVVCQSASVASWPTGVRQRTRFSDSSLVSWKRVGTSDGAMTTLLAIFGLVIRFFIFNPPERRRAGGSAAVSLLAMHQFSLLHAGSWSMTP